MVEKLVPTQFGRLPKSVVDEATKDGFRDVQILADYSRKQSQLQGRGILNQGRNWEINRKTELQACRRLRRQGK